MRAATNKKVLRDEHAWNHSFLGNGFRLDRFEVYNWGLFDGAVHIVEPRGDNFLIVGENGSGKSTLVDALLTLLVRPQTRNYNVAAGASKNERDERTYIRGAYDRTAGADGNPVVQYLRDGLTQYSSILAVFRNQSSGDCITLCQVLHINSENAVEKIYAHCHGDKSIAGDLIGLKAGAPLAKQLKQRGFDAATSYSQYFQWLQSTTGLKAKAMDIFNQTVAVKDVQRLDTFIRQHMLEKHSWTERLQRVLVHFQELSDAHRVLVKARHQMNLLAPIVEAGARLQSERLAWEHALAIADAAPVFFANKTLLLLEPRVRVLHQELQRFKVERDSRDHRISLLHRDLARQEIELEARHALAPERVPSRIVAAQELAKSKREALRQWHALLLHCEIKDQVRTKKQFLSVRQLLQQQRPMLQERRSQLQRELSQCDEMRRNHARELEADRRELASLTRHRGKLASSLSEIRERMCAALSISDDELPFAAELMSVREADMQWQETIETILYGLARSLLIPETHYHRVAAYLDASPIRDARGQGQRLAYLCVRPHAAANRRATREGELIDMLEFRTHLLTPWLKSEIASRFNYKACDSLESFVACTGPAMTVNRHYKSHPVRHCKDDRRLGGEQHRMVLGWDNRDQKAALELSIEEHRQNLSRLDSQQAQLQTQLEDALRKLDANASALACEDYHFLDPSVHDREIAAWEAEKVALKKADDVEKVLEAQTEKLREELQASYAERDRWIEQATRIEGSMQQCERRLHKARRILDSEAHRRESASQQRLWELLEVSIDIPLDEENLDSFSEATERRWRDEANQLALRLKPLEREMLAAMGRYLKAFPEDSVDLDPDIASYESFLALDEQLRAEDLPKYEVRFRSRLNEKVLHELGMLQCSLENDRQEIRDRIEQWNTAMRQMDWKPGTYMRLEASDVNDREISDFRREMHQCLVQANETQTGIDEATFQRIEKLVERLRDPSTERWREKVIDVRNWFHFAAREIVAETGESRSYYEGGSGQSGGEKGKLAFLVLVAAIAYQYDLKPQGENRDRFQFVMVDEMFSRSDDAHAEFALQLFQRFGLQLMIVAPLDAKARITEPYVGTYVHVVKDKQTHRSELISISAEQLRDVAEAE